MDGFCHFRFIRVCEQALADFRWAYLVMNHDHALVEP